MRENDHGHTATYGTFLRALSWLRSLSKLNEPSDFQAVTAGARALFESSVDLALFLHDSEANPIEKLVAWERSAKLAAAERTRDFYAGQTIPDTHVERVTFANRQGVSVARERLHYWPQRDGRPRHPPRWTGRTLSDDARVADSHADYRFRQFYDTRFSEWCWGTHGSGLALVRGVSEDVFPALAAFALSECAQLGLHASRIALTLLGLGDDPIVAARFRQLEEDRVRARALAFGEQKYGAG